MLSVGVSRWSGEPRIHRRLGDRDRRSPARHRDGLRFDPLVAASVPAESARDAVHAVLAVEEDPRGALVEPEVRALEVLFAGLRLRKLLFVPAIAAVVAVAAVTAVFVVLARAAVVEQPANPTVAAVPPTYVRYVRRFTFE